MLTHDDIRWFLPGELSTLTLAHPGCLPDILNAIQFATDYGTSDEAEPAF